MQNDDPNTESFNTSSGVRQGGKEGPPFYNLYSDFSLRICQHRKMSAGVSGLSIPYNIPDEATNRTQRANAPSSGQYDDNDCGYADDLAAVAWTPGDLQTIINILCQVFSEFGLTINLSKTETMILNWDNSLEEQYPESIISINDIPVKNSASFKYLGVWFSCDTVSIGKDELNHRVNSAHNAFSEHRKLLTNMHIRLSTSYVSTISCTITTDLWVPHLETYTSRDQQNRNHLSILSSMYGVEWSCSSEPTCTRS